MKPDLREIGSTGLNSQSGYIHEDLITDLRGARWINTVQKMSEQDAIIGSMLFSIEMLIRRTGFSIVPADGGEDVAEFVESCFDDMSMSWNDTLSEILTMLPFGWAWMEEIYKVRSGDSRDAKKRSKFNDGRIGWRKWSIRGQNTLNRWVFDDDGGIQAMEQIAPPRYRRAIIPIQKSLLFRTTVRRGNPEGRSILRNAYISWHYRNNIARIEGVGIERDLAGLPVAYVPASALSSTATDAEKALVTAVKDIVTKIRRDEKEGVIWPLAYDDNNNEMYRLALLSTGGTRQFDTDKIISRYDQRILMSVLADFILLGHEKVGSFSLSADKTDLFVSAISAWLNSIADVINRHAIPRLLSYNGIDKRLSPKMEFGAVEKVSMSDLADYVSKLTNSELIIPDNELERHLRQQAALPESSEDDRAPNNNEEQAQVDAAQRILARGY